MIRGAPVAADGIDADHDIPNCDDEKEGSAKDQEGREPHLQYARKDRVPGNGKQHKHGCADDRSQDEYATKRRPLQTLDQIEEIHAHQERVQEHKQEQRRLDESRGRHDLAADRHWGFR